MVLNWVNYHQLNHLWNQHSDQETEFVNSEFRKQNFPGSQKPPPPVPFQSLSPPNPLAKGDPSPDI